MCTTWACWVILLQAVECFYIFIFYLWCCWRHVYKKFPMLQVEVRISCSGPEGGKNTCGVCAVFWKESGSLYWWLTENRKTFSKADEVRGLRLFFCYGTITSYLPGWVLLSSPCNCDLCVKTKPLSLTNKGSTFRFTWLHLSDPYRYESWGSSVWPPKVNILGGNLSGIFIRFNSVTKENIKHRYCVLYRLCK